jgi:hypothetical protein
MGLWQQRLPKPQVEWQRDRMRLNDQSLAFSLSLRSTQEENQDGEG